MIDRTLIAEILDQALKKGGDFAEIYIEEKISTGIYCEEDRIEKINSGREKGAGIRVLADEKTSYVHTNDLSREGLLKAAAVAGHAARSGRAGSGSPICLQTKSAPAPLRFQKLPEEVRFEEKIEQVLAANKVARDVSEEIKQVTVAVGDTHKQVMIANSEGDLIEDDRVRIRFIVNTVASRDGVIQTGYESAGGLMGWEMLDQVSPEDMARKAGELAVKMLAARPAPVGRMPVVMSSEAGGTMVHEACGHGLEADLVQKGLSVYGGKIGTRVAAPQVSVIDDATLAGKYGTLRFDDEGTLGQRTVLIQDGVLTGYMYDRLTAQKDGVDSTGNGRRESYQHKPIPRMTNTLIAAGQDDPEEIIRSTSRGLLVRKMGGGQVNTTNGDFVFDVQEGYLIEDGRVSAPVRGATLSGNGPEVLKHIDRVGRDLGFAIGTCGKDGQGVPVADAQPTIRIKELTVGGTFHQEGPGIRTIRRK